MPKHDSKWLKSEEVRKSLNVRACDVMHLRDAGKLRFKKKGNAFLYSKEDVDQARRS